MDRLAYRDWADRLEARMTGANPREVGRQVLHVVAAQPPETNPYFTEGSNADTGRDILRAQLNQAVNSRAN